MQAQLEQQAQLQSELSALQQQLAEANQGLRAASRLSDQLEAGQQAIAVLRDEGESMHRHPARASGIRHQACPWILTNPKNQSIRPQPPRSPQSPQSRTPFHKCWQFRFVYLKRIIDSASNPLSSYTISNTF